jgi:hypothetical protein
MKRILAGCLLVFLVGVVSVSASNIPYTDPASQGTQAWGGNLALNFNVVAPIILTELGVFNAAGNGVITGTISVVIYDLTSHTQVTPMVTFHGTYATAGLGYDVFQTITPVTLGVGSYQVDAVGFSGTDLNGNLNTGSSSGPLLNGGGNLLFAGAAWDSSSTLDGPTSCAGCVGGSAQSSQFDAGTFAFTAVPEPGSLMLIGSGVLVLAGVIRRKINL